MHLQYLSDLHLEFPANREYLRLNPVAPVADILIIAGDTYYLNKPHVIHEFLDYFSANFRQTYLIPGNHEYYGGHDLNADGFRFRQNLRDNVTLLNNATEIVDGARLIFSTMWSDINRHQLEISRGLNDFRLIKYKGEPLTVASFNALHYQSMDFLRAEIGKPHDGPTVVITHHLPADGCNDPRFRGSTLNPAFCTDYTDYLTAADVDAWIYGHSHRNVPDFDLGGTRVITNQLGYVQYGEQSEFDSGKTIEV